MFNIDPSGAPTILTTAVIIGAGVSILVCNWLQSEKQRKAKYAARKASRR